MANGTAVDTLKIYERLKAANLDEKAAKELAEVIKEVEQYHLAELATKRDLTEEITKLELRLKHDLTIRMGAMAAATIAILAAIVKPA